MSIIITNTGSTNNQEKPDERIYNISIKAKTIAWFTHERHQGLGQCLINAALAVLEQEQEEEDQRQEDQRASNSQGDR